MVSSFVQLAMQRRQNASNAGARFFSRKTPKEWIRLAKNAGCLCLSSLSPPAFSPLDTKYIAYWGLKCLVYVSRPTASYL